jgi:hypothetical protein
MSKQMKIILIALVVIGILLAVYFAYWRKRGKIKVISVDKTAKAVTWSAPGIPQRTDNKLDHGIIGGSAADGKGTWTISVEDGKPAMKITLKKGDKTLDEQTITF